MYISAHKLINDSYLHFVQNFFHQKLYSFKNEQITLARKKKSGD